MAADSDLVTIETAARLMQTNIIQFVAWASEGDLPLYVRKSEMIRLIHWNDEIEEPPSSEDFMFSAS
jgi:hypothetical protein